MSEIVFERTARLHTDSVDDVQPARRSVSREAAAPVTYGAGSDGPRLADRVSRTAWDEASLAFAEGRETDEVWRELRFALLPVVRRKLATLPFEVEDVVADTFLNLIELRARGQYDATRGTVVALAGVIAGRRCTDRLRRRYQAQTGSLDAMAERVLDGREAAPHEPADPGPSLEDRVIVHQLVRTWRVAFRDALTELRREDERIGSSRALAVLLRHRCAIEDDDFSFLFDPRGPGAGGAPWRDIAERLGQTEQAARQNGSRGLRALRQLLQRRGFAGSPAAR